MRLQQLPIEFEEALPLLEKIKSAGFEAYFVGGSVRDVLLGRPIHDVDIATSSYPEETKAIFARTVDVGIEHGTVLVLENGHEYEVTTFRTEDAYVDYRRPSSVSFVRSLKEDLKRRDFTVNAFALSDDGQIIDLFDGLSDLKQGLLRAVGLASERFNEDALRIMRGIRFAASLDFDIEEKTLEAMTACAPLLEKISVERSFVEFNKLMLSPHWSKGLSVLMVTKAYDFLPHLAGTRQVWQRMLADIETDYVFQSSEQAWTAILLSLEHREPKAFLKKWKTSVQFQKKVCGMMTLFQERSKQELSKWQVYQYGYEIAAEVEALRAAFGLPADMERLERLDRTLAIHDKHEIVVNGGLLIVQLGLQPGPALGRYLHQVEKAIVNDSLANDKEAIFAYIQKLSDNFKE